MNPLAQLIIAAMPALVAEIKARHAAADPNAVPPSSAQIVAMLETVFRASQLRDQALRIALQAEIDGAKPAV